MLNMIIPFIKYNNCNNYQSWLQSLKPLTLLIDLLIFLVLIFLDEFKVNSIFLFTFKTDRERGKSAVLKEPAESLSDTICFLAFVVSFCDSMCSLTLFRKDTICFSSAMCICLLASVCKQIKYKIGI